MIIESFEIKSGTVKRLPTETEFLSVCVKKVYEIGRLEERIVVSVRLHEDMSELENLENREFILADANEPFVTAEEGYSFHGIVALCNQTDIRFVLSRSI